MIRNRKDRGQAYGLLSSWLERQRFITASRRVKGRRILDVGCGVADFSKWLPEGVEYVGVESDPEIVDAARRRHHDLEIIPGEIRQGNQLLTQYSERPFDSIVLAAVLEHLSNPKEVLAELHSVLAHDGIVVITTPVPGAEWLLSLGAWLGLTSKEAHDEHHSLYGRDDLFDLLDAAGYEVQHYQRFLFGLNQIVVGAKKVQGS